MNHGYVNYWLNLCTLTTTGLSYDDRYHIMEAMEGERRIIEPIYIYI